MNISLLNKIYDSKILNIPYWERIQNGIDAQTIPGSKRIDELRDISQSHQNTRERIAFADYHIHNLDQIYIRHTTPRYTETPRWAMAEMHGTISNLYSALDSLSRMRLISHTNSTYLQEIVSSIIMHRITRGINPIKIV